MSRVWAHQILFFQIASVVEKIILLTLAKNQKASLQNAPYVKATTQPTIEDARFIKNINLLNNQKEKPIISKKINVNLSNVNTISNLTTDSEKKTYAQATNNTNENKNNQTNIPSLLTRSFHPKIIVLY